MAQHRTHDRSTARRGGRTPRDRNRRTLSQNFLRDHAAIRQLVRAARPGPHDLIVEVGAGEGDLTEALGRAAGRVLAYELDPLLAARLAARFRGDTVIRCRPADFLAARPPGEPFAVVGNIPFGLTAQVVRWCLTARPLRAATMVTQLEYARRRAGWYGRWSRLTVQTWPAFEWRLMGRIPRAKFRPVPSVDAGILGLERRSAMLLPAAAMPAYRRLVELGFGGMGGSLHASLRRRYPRGRLAVAFRSAGVDPQTAVGYVRPEQWLVLFLALHPEAAPVIHESSSNPGSMDA